MKALKSVSILLASFTVMLSAQAQTTQQQIDKMRSELAREQMQIACDNLKRSIRQANGRDTAKGFGDSCTNRMTSDECSRYLRDQQACSAQGMWQ
jgi:hypothetical protein